MPQISVVIITFNEEKNIARCLESVQELADEILVVDSFSTDATQAICEDYGARFMQHAFAGHIQQKNYALQQAKFDHVLSLDADEALCPKLAQAIGQAKENWQGDGYTMNRLTNYCGHWIHHCGWYPDTKLRLADRRKGSWGGTNPHDKLLLEEGCSTSQLSGDILHYTFYTRQEHVAQVHAFTDIAAKAAHEKGRKANGLQVALYTAAKFFQGYVLQLGFLDGMAGFHVCRISAYASYLKYGKIRRLASRKSP